MPYIHRKLTWLAIVLLASVNLLSACGQKGPLYPPPAEERSQAAQPGPDSAFTR